MSVDSKRCMVGDKEIRKSLFAIMGVRGTRKIEGVGYTNIQKYGQKHDHTRTRGRTHVVLHKYKRIQYFALNLLTFSSLIMVKRQ